ncbi:hypothetical protein AAMO2058_001612900 [Amorphochlora amoebiformis]
MSRLRPHLASLCRTARLRRRFAVARGIDEANRELGEVFGAPMTPSYLDSSATVASQQPDRPDRDTPSQEEVTRRISKLRICLADAQEHLSWLEQHLKVSKR